MEKFYEYFQENMEAMGFSAPKDLFKTVAVAAATAKTILDAVDKYGTKVTVAELGLAGGLSEGLGFVATVAAAFYVGAVIGSIGVAIQRCLTKGATLADLISVASRYSLHRPWLTEVLVVWSGIYDTKLIARSTYCQQMSYA